MSEWDVLIMEDKPHSVATLCSRLTESPTRKKFTNYTHCSRRETQTCENTADDRTHAGEEVHEGPVTSEDNSDREAPYHAIR